MLLGRAVLWIESGVVWEQVRWQGREARAYVWVYGWRDAAAEKEFKDTWTDVLQGGEESLAVGVFFRRLRELGMLGFEGYHGCFVRQD